MCRRCFSSLYYSIPYLVKMPSRASFITAVCVIQFLNQLFELREIGAVKRVGFAFIDAFKLFFFLGAWALVLDQVSP